MSETEARFRFRVQQKKKKNTGLSLKSKPPKGEKACNTPPLPAGRGQKSPGGFYKKMQRFSEKDAAVSAKRCCAPFQ